MDTESNKGITEPTYKICPLLSLNGMEIRCKESYCAWWNEYQSCCAIEAIPCTIQDGFEDLVRSINSK